MRYVMLFVMLFISGNLFAQTQKKATQVPQNPQAAQVPQKPDRLDYPLDLKTLGLVLPKVDDPELNEILQSPDTIFYKLPQVWQHYIPSSRIEYNNLTLGTKSYSNTDSVWGLYYSSHNSDFNANPLFPWETTVGLNSSHKDGDKSYRTVDFLSLPKVNGKKMPVLYVNELPGKWIFPPGTMVGEIIYVVHDNQRYVQEIRTRRKSKDSTDWEPHAHRPIVSREEFIRLIGKDYTPAYKYMFFRNPQEDEVFKMDGLVERLPPLSESKVKSLLSRPFKRVTDWSPASDQDFHILPKNYCFSLLQSIDSITCANCHRQTQISVRNLTPKEPLVINNFEKVGNIRGSDTVFTWHPFSEESIRSSDQEPEPRLNFRRVDVKNGVIRVAEEDDEQLLGDYYKLTLFVQESLKDYELPPKKFLHNK